MLATMMLPPHVTLIPQFILFKQLGKYDLTDFRKDALNLYVWEGGLYALPRDYGNQNLFLNLDLLAKAGIPQPPVDWAEKSFTFEVFLDMAKKLTVKQGDKVTQWGFLVNRGWRPWASWVYCNGGTAVKRAGALA